jgi:hypothetical protein
MSIRFELPPDSPVRAYAIARPDQPLHYHAAGVEVRVVDPLDVAHRDYCLAMNRANCIAYDGSPTPGVASTALGMPLWVFLDCCVLPSAVVGFEMLASAMPDDLRRAIDPTLTQEWLPFTEYIALPSARLGEVVGVSLFSFAGTGHWGRRTKALGLLVHAARQQIGVAQYTNPSVRLHLSLGPLRLLSRRTEVHSRPAETFVYTTSVASPQQLRDIVSDGGRGVCSVTRVDYSFDPRDSDALGRFAEYERGRVALVVDAGEIEDGLVTRIDVAFE